VDDARALLQVARDDRLDALWAVALNIGLREDEALALRWWDVDLDAGTLRVAQTVQRVGGVLVFSEPKTARSRRTCGCRRSPRGRPGAPDPRTQAARPGRTSWSRYAAELARRAITNHDEWPAQWVSPEGYSTELEHC
jgi:integrase